MLFGVWTFSMGIYFTLHEFANFGYSYSFLNPIIFLAVAAVGLTLLAMLEPWEWILE